MKPFLIVAVGSGIGGMLRYGMQLVTYKFIPTIFPLGTFFVNILGCFLIGVFFAMAEKSHTIGPEMRLLLITGVCGGFTTFSTFSFDNLALLKAGEYLSFSLYLAGSVFLGLLASFLGMQLIRPA